MSNYTARWLACALSLTTLPRLVAAGTLAALAFAVGVGDATAQDGKSFATNNVVGAIKKIEGTTFAIGADGTVTETIFGTQTIKITVLTAQLQIQAKKDGTTVWKDTGKVFNVKPGKKTGLVIEWSGPLWDVSAGPTDVFSVITELQYEVFQGAKSIKKETRFDRSGPIKTPTVSD